MWSVFIQPLLFIAQSIGQSLHVMYLEVMLQQFLLLGVIPGTAIQLELNDIVLILMYMFIAFIVIKLYATALRFIDAIDPDKDLPPGINRIDLIAL